MLDLEGQQPVHAVHSATEQDDEDDHESGQPANLPASVLSDFPFRFRKRVADHPYHRFLAECSPSSPSRLWTGEHFLRSGAHPFDEQHRAALAEHDLVAEPNRHRLGDAFAVQVRAVLALGIADHETAARANRQLGMDARHGRVVRLEGLDLAFPPPSQTDAGAACLETLAGGVMSNVTPYARCSASL